MRRSIIDIAFVKKNITAFQISIALSPAPYRAITVGGRATQAKAWAKFPRPFGPTGPHADSADSADSADNADSADSADSADNAGNAQRPTANGHSWFNDSENRSRLSRKRNDGRESSFE
jgi:hypothetical protein